MTAIDPRFRGWCGLSTGEACLAFVACTAIGALHAHLREGRTPWINLGIGEDRSLAIALADGLVDPLAQDRPC